MDLKIRYIIISLIVIAVISWLFPVKIVMNSNDKIQQFAESGKVVLLCKYQQVTGPLWRVEKYFGTKSCPEDIEIIGDNIPFLKLRFPIYNNYYDDTFIFIGKFDEENDAIFEVTDWNIWGMKHTFSFYPPYGFNIYEYKFRIDESDAEEYEEKTRENVKLYQLENTI